MTGKTKERNLVRSSGNSGPACVAMICSRVGTDERSVVDPWRLLIDDVQCFPASSRPAYWLSVELMGFPGSRGSLATRIH